MPRKKYRNELLKVNKSYSANPPLAAQIEQSIAELYERLKQLKVLDKQRSELVRFLNKRQLLRADVMAVARTLPTKHTMGDGAARSDKGKKRPAKYRHPTDKSLTWSGMARQPNWLKDYLKVKGHKLEDLAIKS